MFQPARAEVAALFWVGRGLPCVKVRVTKADAGQRYAVSQHKQVTLANKRELYVPLDYANDLVAAGVVKLVPKAAQKTASEVAQVRGHAAQHRIATEPIETKRKRAQNNKQKPKGKRQRSMLAGEDLKVKEERAALVDGALKSLHLSRAKLSQTLQSSSDDAINILSALKFWFAGHATPAAAKAGEAVWAWYVALPEETKAAAAAVAAAAAAAPPKKKSAPNPQCAQYAVGSRQYRQNFDEAMLVKAALKALNPGSARGASQVWLLATQPQLSGIKRTALNLWLSARGYSSRSVAQAGLAAMAWLRASKKE